MTKTNPALDIMANDESYAELRRFEDFKNIGDHISGIYMGSVETQIKGKTVLQHYIVPDTEEDGALVYFTETFQLAQLRAFNLGDAVHIEFIGTFNTANGVAKDFTISVPRSRVREMRETLLQRAKLGGSLRETLGLPDPEHDAFADG